MAKRLQLRGGTTIEHSTFTGANKEVTVDTAKNILVVHDGVKAGGYPTVTLTENPTVSSSIVTVNEMDTINITIDNYSQYIDYSVKTLDALVATISVVGNTISITGSDILANSSTVVSVNAKASGLAISEWVDITVDVIFVPIVADTAVAFSNTDIALNDGFTIGA